MLLLLGSQDTETPSFAEEFASGHPIEVLNESTFKELLPRMDKTTPILLEKGITLGKYKEELLKTIKERDMVIFMKDCNAGDLLGYVAVSPSGKYVAVKSSSNGRRQQVLVINEVDVSYDVVEEKLEKTAEKKSGVQPPPGEEERTQVPAQAHTTTGVEMTSLLAQFIKDDSRYDGEPVHYWEYNTSLYFANFSTTPNVDGEPWLSKGTVKTFCTVDFTLYATKTPRYKWINVKLTDAVGMTSSMGNDSNWARGFFNNYAFVYVFPGDESPHNSQLPPSWSRPYIEPHTPNSATTYTSTTGWSVGVEGGGDKDGPKANVTASYNQSNQVQRTINDFSVRNISDGSMTGWNFYYTAIDGDKWNNHFDFWNNVDYIADLAKSTLTLNAEGVYRGPADTNEKLQWSVLFKPTFSLLRANYVKRWIYFLEVTSSLNMTIDMGVVKNPEK